MSNREYTIRWDSGELDKWFKSDTFEKACEYRANVAKSAKEHWGIEVDGAVIWRTVDVTYGDWVDSH